MEKTQLLIGNTSWKVPFSIAMLDYRSVVDLGKNPNRCLKVFLSMLPNWEQKELIQNQPSPLTQTTKRLLKISSLLTWWNSQLSQGISSNPSDWLEKPIMTLSSFVTNPPASTSFQNSSPWAHHPSGAKICPFFSYSPPCSFKRSESKHQKKNWIQEISNGRTHVSRTPKKKTENLIARP